MEGGDKRGGEWLCVTVCALRVSLCRFLLPLGGDEREFVVLHLRGSSGDVPQPVGRCVALRVWVGNCLPGTSGRVGVRGWRAGWVMVCVVHLGVYVLQRALFILPVSD